MPCRRRSEQHTRRSVRWCLQSYFDKQHRSEYRHRFQTPKRFQWRLALPVKGIIKDAIKEAILEGDIPNEYDAAKEYMLKKGAELGLKAH